MHCRASDLLSPFIPLHYTAYENIYSRVCQVWIRSDSWLRDRAYSSLKDLCNLADHNYLVGGSCISDCTLWPQIIADWLIRHTTADQKPQHPINESLLHGPGCKPRGCGKSTILQIPTLLCRTYQIGKVPRRLFSYGIKEKINLFFLCNFQFLYIGFSYRKKHRNQVVRLIFALKAGTESVLFLHPRAQACQIGGTDEKFWTILPT